MRKLILFGIIFISVTRLNAQNLQQYINIAAENNPGLKAKYKEFEASVQRVAQVSKLEDPVLSFGYFISPVETRVGPQQAKISLSQMFPWFGSLKVKENAATLESEALYQAFLDYRNKTYMEVALAYYPIYELNKLIQLEQENNSILSYYKELAAQRLSNEKGTLSDVLRADIKLKESKNTLEILRQKKRPLQARFNRILNRPLSSEIIIEDTLIMSKKFHQADSIQANNPLIKQLELKEKALLEQKELANKQGLPSIGLGLDYVFVGQRDNLPSGENGRDVIMPMLSVRLPIARNKYKAAIKEASLKSESIALAREDKLNQLMNDYDLAVFEINQQLDLLELYNQQIKDSEQLLALSKIAYSNDNEDFEEVLSIHQKLISYKKEQLSAMVNYHEHLARLNYITAK